VLLGRIVFVFLLNQVRPCSNQGFGFHELPPFGALLQPACI
jgi:hypothetical protein